MLLAIDIGNTTVALGLFDDRTLLHHWRVQSDRDKTADEYGVLLRSLFASAGLDPAAVGAMIVSSVVPPLTPIFQALGRDLFGAKALVIGPGLKTGMPILYEVPLEVGADRVVAAVAAFEKYGGPCIVADYGTATTFDVISVEGDYVGGVIAPGIEVSLEALTSRAAKLIKVELVEPEHTIGKSTTEALQSGAVYGFAGEIEGIVHAIWEELGERAQVIATGGLADLIARHTDVISAVDPFLTLRGIEIVMRRQQRA